MIILLNIKNKLINCSATLLWTISPFLKKAEECNYPVVESFQHNFNSRRVLMSNNKTPMTPKSASRIQSSTAKQNGGQVAKGSFAARAASSSSKNSGSNQQGNK